jgi:methyl-accepting chemotaxis protein
VGVLVGEIDVASSEQSKGIDEVNKAVAEMDKVTQQNAANAEESASASEEMSGQAQELNGMLATFKLNRADNGNGNGKSRMAGEAVSKRPDNTFGKFGLAKKVKPEMIIPMNDDYASDADFKDF